MTPVPSEILDDDVDLAVRQLVEPWLTGSNGHADVVCVEGGVAEALGALGLRRARVAELDTARRALAWLAWAGASGGAHGRRRGAASGRFGAWWTLAALGDLLDDWPVPPDELGELAAELRWYRWDAHEPAMGWQLQLAVEDPDERSPGRSSPATPPDRHPDSSDQLARDHRSHRTHRIGVPAANGAGVSVS